MLLFEFSVGFCISKLDVRRPAAMPCIDVLLHTMEKVNDELQVRSTTWRILSRS
jgi:hypothetical protein